MTKPPPSPMQLLANEYGVSWEYLHKVRNGRALQAYYERYHGKPARYWERDNLDRRMEARRMRKKPGCGVTIRKPCGRIPKPVKWDKLIFAPRFIVHREPSVLKYSCPLA